MHNKVERFKTSLILEGIIKEMDTEVIEVADEEGEYQNGDKTYLNEHIVPL